MYRLYINYIYKVFYLFLICFLTTGLFQTVIAQNNSLELIDINRKIIRDSKNSNLYCDRADYYLKNNNLKFALKEYQNAYLLRSENLRANIGQASIFFSENKLDTALYFCNHIISISDTIKVAYYIRAQIYFKKNQLNNAKADYERILKHNPKQYNVYFLLGLIAEKENDFLQAATLFKNAIKNDTLKQQAFLKTINSYFAIKKYDSALYYTNQLEKNYPTIPQSYNFKGQIYYKTNQINNAISAFKKTKTIDKNNTVANYNLGKIYYEKNKIELCKQYMDLVITENPFYANAHLYKSLCFIKTKHIDSALYYLDKTTISNPKVDTAFYLKSKIYYEQNKNQTAIINITQAIELNPMPEYHYHRALCFFESDSLNKAKIDIDYTIRHIKNSCKYYLLAVSIYKKLNLHKEIKKLFTEIANSDSLNNDCLEKINQLINH